MIPEGEAGGTWRPVAELVRGAPPRMKLTLVLSVAGAVGAVVVGAAGILGEAQTTAGLFRLVGLISGMGGLALISVTHVLHHLSQQSSVACARMNVFRLEYQVLHRLLMLSPVAAMVAGGLLSVAIGIYLQAAIDRPILFIVVALFAYYLLFSIRTIAETSRFLYGHAREQAEAAARARTEAAEAQLSALQAQVNPHFLFNALNTVASLVRTDAAAAEAAVENLAEVLRRTLARSRHTLTTLGEEVDYLKAYLSIEQERWGDRLAVQWDLESDTLDLLLPPMTLQPLVENALRHGLGTRLEGGAVRIAARRRNGRLELSVSDNGVGFPPRHSDGNGLGNLRARLRTLFGDDSTVRVESERGRGSRVMIELPVRRQERL